MSRQITGEGMEAPTRNIHVIGKTDFIQQTQLTPQLTGMGGLYPSLAASREKNFKALVAKAFDHPLYPILLHPQVQLAGL